MYFCHDNGRRRSSHCNGSDGGHGHAGLNLLFRISLLDVCASFRVRNRAGAGRAGGEDSIAQQPLAYIGGCRANVSLMGIELAATGQVVGPL